ncbi:MAG: helix-turn-helix domain-containing protein [Bdellovibrio sp.]
MLETFSQINAEALRFQLKNQKMSQTELATRLGVNIKTVQRWVNGHVSKVRLETVEQVSQMLQCSQSDISCPIKIVNVGAKNKILEELFSQEIIQALNSNKQWSSYLKLLKEFEEAALPTDQEAQLYFHLGYVQYQLGFYRSAKRYFSRAASKAEALQSPHMIIRVKCYCSSNLLMLGEVQQALQILEEAEQLNTTEGDLFLLSEIFYRKAKLYLTNNEFDMANNLLRRSILLEMKTCSHKSRGLSLKYIQLARLELRCHRYDKAWRFYVRAESHAHKWNLRTNEAVANYGKALVSLVNQKSEEASQFLKKARRLAGGASEIEKSQKFLQIEFMFAIYQKDYERCAEILSIRYMMNRRSKLLLVNTVKMAVLLDRVSKGAYPVRPQWSARAQKYLKALSGHVNYEHFRKISRSSSMSFANFADLIDCMIL